MNINKNNYEAYLLDYFENNLSTEMIAELLVFLQSHPELNVDLDSFDLISVQPDKTVVYEDKASLKQSGVVSYSFLNCDNYEEYFVASIDGELFPEQEKDLQTFIGLNPGLMKEYELFRLTVLVPDTNVIFERKSSLKKGTFGITHINPKQWIYTAFAVAASVVLLIGFFFDFSIQPEPKQLAQKQNSQDNSSLVLPQRDFKIPSYSIQQQHPNHNIAGGKLDNAIASVQNQNTETTVKQQSPGMAEPGLAGLQVVTPVHTTILPVNISGQGELLGVERSYYTELYSFIQLREQREYQEYLDNQVDRSWYNKAFSEIKGMVFGPEQYDPKGVKRDSEIWMLAEAGIKGFNYITRSDFRLKRQLDEDGRTSAYAVASDHFQYAGKVGK